MENKNIKKIVFIIMGIVIFIMLICLVKYFLSSNRKFKINLDNDNVSELERIYKETQNYDDKKSLEKMFKFKMDSVVEEFISGIKSYEESIEEIKKYEQITALESFITSAKEDIEKVKNSKDSFSKAQDNQEKHNVLETIKHYLEVIELDKNNYKIAQDYIKSNKNNLKVSTLQEIDSLIANNDYVTANEKLKVLEEIFSNDKEITAKTNQIKDKAKEQEIEKFKNEQEVSVISAKTHQEYYSDTISGITVVVKNNTNKVVKDYTVGMLGYDSNGYPLKIEYKSNLSFGNAQSANIQPQGTHGEGTYYSIHYEEEKIKTVLACIKEATYYDGSKWENPYFEYWEEQYKEKPIQ